MMNLNNNQAIILQNLKASTVLTSNDKSGIWAQLMLFDDGSTVLIRGEKGGSDIFTDILYGSPGKSLEHIDIKTWRSLVERYK